MGNMTLLPDYWITFIDAIRSGAVRFLHFRRVDFSALNDGALMVLVGCRGLQSLTVDYSVVPVGFVRDDLIRASVAKGFPELHLSKNTNGTPHRISEDATLGFFFPADSARARQAIKLRIEGSRITDTFFTKFVEVKASHMS